MYDSAARIQEMLDLRVCDIRLGNTPTAILKGKGSKIRSVPLMPETINHFQNYMKLFHPNGHMHSHACRMMFSGLVAAAYRKKERMQAKRWFLVDAEHPFSATSQSR